MGGNPADIHSMSVMFILRKPTDKVSHSVTTIFREKQPSQNSAKNLLLFTVGGKH